MSAASAMLIDKKKSRKNQTNPTIHSPNGLAILYPTVVFRPQKKTNRRAVCTSMAQSFFVCIRFALRATRTNVGHESRSEQQ